MTGSHIIAIRDDLNEVILFHKIFKEENLDEQS